MSLKNFTIDNGFFNITKTNKYDAIKELIDYLYNIYPLNIDKETLISQLYKREKTRTTSIGMGFSIPHTRIENLDNEKILWGINKNGIEYDSIDNKPVYTIILLLSPVDPMFTNAHIKTLSNITHMLSYSEITEQFHNISTYQDLITTLEYADNKYLLS